MPRFAATARMVSISAVDPPRCTGRIARVLDVMAASILVASIWKVSMSESTKTGSAYCNRTGLIVATNVYGGTITSSPGPISKALIVVNRAVVPHEVAKQCATPSVRAQALSNSVAWLPSSRHHFPSRSTFIQLCSSLAAICGQEVKGRSEEHTSELQSLRHLVC